jgi:hypothetical protein
MRQLVNVDEGGIFAEIRRTSRSTLVDSPMGKAISSVQSRNLQVTDSVLLHNNSDVARWHSHCTYDN